MKRENKNKKLQIKLCKRTSIILAIFVVISLGMIYAVSDFASKGDLDGSGKVDYEDVKLLEEYLIHSKVIPEEKIDIADMNNDNNVTITDLTLLIQKIEKTLDYEVSIRDLKLDNYYPEKNSDITLSFNADVSYGEEIEKIIINGTEVNIARNVNNENKYELKIRVGNQCGVQLYNIEKVILANQREVKIKEAFKIDVLKLKPELKNWKVEENIQNSELKVSYDIEDVDGAFKSATYNITEKVENIKNDEAAQNTENTEDTEETDTKLKDALASGEVKVGHNEITVKIEEEKEYQFEMCLTYNRDTDTLEQEEGANNEGFETIHKNMSLIINYELELKDIKTYNIEKNVEANEFKVGEAIAIEFNSTNKTTFIPESVVINNKTYKLEAQEENENSYVTIIDGLKETGNQTITIEKIILNNSKELEVNQTKQVRIIKNTPTVVNWRTNKEIEPNIDPDKNKKKMTLHIYLKDTEKAICNLTLKVYDDENAEILSQNLTNELNDNNLIKEEATDENLKNTYYIIKELDISHITKINDFYTLKLFADYTLLENVEGYSYTNKDLGEDKVEVPPSAIIREACVSKKYYEKNEDITLTYKIDTNKKDRDITRIMVNNVRCNATKHIDNDENVTYTVTLNAGDKAGKLNMIATEVRMGEDLTDTVYNSTEVEVLKTKPTSQAFSQSDDIANHSVTLTANIVDPDEALIRGVAELIEDETGKRLGEPKIFDAEHITFKIDNVKLDTKYTLVAKMTYDRDSEKKVGSDNYVEDEEFRRRPIKLVSDYKAEINNLKTYINGKESKYLERGQQVTVSFDSGNSTEFYPESAVITVTDTKTQTSESKTYNLIKNENNYKVVIPVVSKYGPKEIKIEKLILNNTKEIPITENNKVEVGILKLRPTVENFGYNEANNNINVTFTVNDTEETITGGRIIVLNEKGKQIKEEAFTRNSNGISFAKEPLSEEYQIKVLADYDLDTNQITQGENEFTNQTLLAETINVSTERFFEVKDILEVNLYKAGTASEVTSLKESDLKNNLQNYIVRVRTRGMPLFYTTIKEYEITNDNKLNFILNYDNVIQYENGDKQNKLKVTYSKGENGVFKNKSIEAIVEEMKKNPTATITLTQDYNASYVEGSSIFPETFKGTLDGNGHTISNLTKPLFTSADGVNIKNLILEDVSLVGAANRGAIANTAQNVTVTNVHIRGLNMTTGADESAGMIGHAQQNCTIEKCSVTGFHIKTNYIRTAAIAGRLASTVINNCYVEGKIESITSTKDGIGGIAGDAFENDVTTIKNCISKVEFINNTRAKNNGGILGLARGNQTTLVNNVSLCTGTGVNKICGNGRPAGSVNNYELEESELISNAYGNFCKKVSKDNINKEFFINEAEFDSSIWNLEGASFDSIPTLKDEIKGTETSKNASRASAELYIPEYSRISQMAGFQTNKLNVYHNLHKLMPYYDAKYLVTDGATIQNTDVLNTKIIQHILPYANNQLITYLTSNDYQKITKIKVVFTDKTVQEYNVKYVNFKQNVAIYKINDTNLSYAFGNYVIPETSSIVSTLKEYIKTVDYTTKLDPLTSAGDSRLYRDNYNGVIKGDELAEHIALQILQNNSSHPLTIKNSILNEKIQKELIDSEKINKLLYGYNYIHRWYNFEIGGAKVSDLLLFEGEMFNTSLTFEKMTSEVLSGDLATNRTQNFYAGNISKYTGISNLGAFLDNIITNVGGYADVNDWFTEWYGSRQILSEISIDTRPDLQYRAWYQVKRQPSFILPLSTLPEKAGYLISAPAQLSVGAQRTYAYNYLTAEGQKAVRNIVANHSKLIKRQFTTLAGSFNRDNWNNYCILVYDSCRVQTGLKTSYLPGTNIPIGTHPVYMTCGNGTSDPYHKNFNEALGLWQYGSAAGVGNTAGFLWFIAQPGLTNYDVWTHEFQHALSDKIMIAKRGMRLKMEVYTQGNVEQRDDWSANNIQGYDVGPYYFNLVYDLNKEGNATQNLTPERINTQEKLENYYKGQLNAQELLDYVSAKAFIQLTPEQQAKIATKVTDTAAREAWGTITADEAATMKLDTLEKLYDNKIILRPNNAWGVSVRGLTPPSSIGGDDYGYESIWVTRWYMAHFDGGYTGVLASKRNLFEMLGYAGVDGYIMYGSRQSSSDLDAIQKITKAKTGTAMNWKEYRMSRYKEVENSIKTNPYVNEDIMIKQFKTALESDANRGDRNIASATGLRKIYYHYLKSVTNDFIGDPFGTDVDNTTDTRTTHIKTAQELIDKINARPYGYFEIDNDLDFTGVTGQVTKTFMGKLNGNGHKIKNNTNSIFLKIRYGSVSNIKFEGTNIPTNVSNVGILSNRTEASVLENISATNVQMNGGGRNEIGLLAGAVSSLMYENCSVEQRTEQITSSADFSKIQANPSGIYNITKDIDFTGYTGSANSVVSSTFTGKLNGNGHTISNLTNKSLFAEFRGTVENLNISNFTNTAVNSNFVAAFAQKTYRATLKNMKFNNITLSGANSVAVVTGAETSGANSVYENISVKNANVTGTGVYVSTFVGRKYGGSIKNVYVQGTLKINSTENGGLMGASQEAVSVQNIITDVAINKTHNTYSNIANSEFNGSMIGNIYNSPSIKNSVAFGNMTGFTDSSGAQKVPFKFTGAVENSVKTYLTKCYEVTEEKGSTRVSANTAGHLDTVSRANLNKKFYQDLGFDESIWNLDKLTAKGYPELK